MRVVKTKQGYFKIKRFWIIDMRIQDIFPDNKGVFTEVILFKKESDARAMIKYIKERKVSGFVIDFWKILRECEIEYFYI
jgi:hypothetical protein